MGTEPSSPPFEVLALFTNSKFQIRNVKFEISLKQRNTTWESWCLPLTIYQWELEFRHRTLILLKDWALDVRKSFVNNRGLLKPREICVEHEIWERNDLLIQHWKRLKRVARAKRKIYTDQLSVDFLFSFVFGICFGLESGAMRKNVNLVDLVKTFPLQNCHSFFFAATCRFVIPRTIW